MAGKITRKELSARLQAELNKAGRLDELTTLDKTNLVNAINEVDSKEVDLTPINNKIGEVEENLGTHLADKMPKIVDTVTAKKYIFGSDNGMIYIQEVAN